MIIENNSDFTSVEHTFVREMLYSYQEISNLTGISKRTLLRAKKTLQIE